MTEATDDPADQTHASVPYRQNLGGVWQLASSVSEAWRFRRLHTEQDEAVGAFARTRWIPARVPGSVHDDLIRAGLIRDPNDGLASLDAEWVSARQWIYRRTFRVELPPGRRLHLCFDGADYGGDVYLDGQLLGTLGGTHTPVRFDISDLNRQEQHLLVVILREPPAEAGQLGHTSETRTLKPRFGYWWDFGTRLIHVGLWRDVVLESDAGSAIVDAFARVQLDAAFTHARVEVELTLDASAGAPVTVELIHPDGTRDVTESEHGTARFATAHFELHDPQLWWPAQLGGQPLYRVRASLPGAPVVERRFGMRHVTLVHNLESAARHARPYTLQINGQTLYARGFNVVPTDLVHGRSSVARRERALIRYALDAHANLLRFNGVGPIASKTLLDACDEQGMLVWQEMPLTSSGTDNVPPQTPEFQALLERDLPPLLGCLRNHPSVVLFTAGNELTDEHHVPISESNATVSRIRFLISAADGTRPFLPTSPSGPEYDLTEDVALIRPQDLHDVHGPWHYRGVHDSYRPHTVNRALAHSEFGCQGTSSEATLHRYLIDGPIWPMDDHNPQVVHHGEWWLMRHRIEEVFGAIGDLATYVLLTQAVQGDVLRHALTFNRARRDECSLALVWQLNEPWPNAHNTSVIDYDLKPKLAYYRCREANAPISIHLGLSGPVARDHLTLSAQVLADLEGSGPLMVTLHDLSGQLLDHQELSLQWPQPGRTVTVPLPHEPALLRAQLHDRQGVLAARCEHWVAPERPEPFAALVRMPRTTLTTEGRGEQLVVRNTGAYVAPWVYLEAPAGVSEHFSDNGFSLLPGEAREVTVRLGETSNPAARTSLTARALNADRRACIMEGS